MHISEGVLSGQVLAAGMVMAAAGTSIGLKKMNLDRVSTVGIMAASFFMASLVHVPVGPSSVHLILNGIIGLLLGWTAFPAILVALSLQAVFFQYGGITTLGVNTVIMATPAVLCGMLFRPLIHRSNGLWMAGAFCCGMFSVLLSGCLVGLSLIFTGENFFEVSAAIVVAHIPVMIIEGIVTVFFVSFVKKVQPAVFASAA